MRRLVAAVIVLVLAAGLAFWVMTMPRRLGATTLAALHPGDATKGERIFWAGGCVSCHGRPGAKGNARLELSGGLELKTPFGTFIPPNISPDRNDGIGAWTLADFANALKRGVSPEGRHYYPAFPYPSYARMKAGDIADLFAFLKTLPPVSGRTPPDRVSFPFSVRRGIGLWKLLYLSERPVVALPADAPQKVKDGQYLVEGPGHCGECPVEFGTEIERPLVRGGDGRNLVSATGLHQKHGNREIFGETTGDDRTGCTRAADDEIVVRPQSVEVVHGSIGPLSHDQVQRANLIITIY